VIVLTFAYAVALFVYVVTFWVKKETHPVFWLYASAGLGIALVAASGWLYAARSGGGVVASLIPVSFLFSAFILGSSLLGMLLGHRYLTNPHLPMSHLNFLAWVFLVAVLLQGGLTVASFSLGLSPEVAFAALRLESVLGLFLWIRLAIGIAVPLVLALMILNTIRYQANMSATGLLYIAVIMVMAGEAFSSISCLPNPSCYNPFRLSINGHLRRCRCASGVRLSTLRSGSRRLATTFEVE
jgi:hypothetical protein